MTNRPIDKDTELLDAAQAAQLIGVSVRTLDRYQNAGLIQPIRAIHKRGAERKFHPQDVQQIRLGRMPAGERCTCRECLDIDNMTARLLARKDSK